MKKLKPYLLETLNLKPEESRKFSLLFFHSFFVGFFIAFYFVPANSVFIQHFGSDKLPLAYLAAGVAGYLVTSIYSYLQKRISSRSLFLSAIGFMFVIAIASRLSLGIVSEKWLSFFVFVWAWPFISLAGIESGGVAIKQLDLRQVKRMFGLINMGGVISSILGYLIIPVLLQFLGHSYDLLLIGSAGCVTSGVLLVVIFKRFPDKRVRVSSNAISEERNKFSNLLKHKYFKLIFASATLSMTAIYISDYGFLASIKVQGDLFKSPDSVSTFLAIVFAALKIGELLVSYFSSRVLSKYGVKLGLTILPITTTVLILFAAITAFLVGADSVLFLVWMVMNKMTERILRRGLDDPSFNILYQTLPEKQQLAVQTKVGVVMQLSIAIAGLLLLGLTTLMQAFDGFNLKLYPLFCLPVLLAWVYFARHLYLSYRDKLREMLTEMSHQKKRDLFKYTYSTEVLTKKFKKFNRNEVLMSAKLLSETNPRLMEPYSALLLQRNDEKLSNIIMKYMDPTWHEDLYRCVANIYTSEDPKEANLKPMAKQTLKLMDFSVSNSYKRDELSYLMQKGKRYDKMLVIKYLTINNFDGDEELIIQLMEDVDRLVQNAACFLAFKRRTPKLKNKLVELFADLRYYHFISSLLLYLGEDMLQKLDAYFTRKVNPAILMKIVEIYAKIDTEKSTSMLVSHLDYPDEDVQLAVIRALNFCQYQAKGKELQIIRKKIEQVVNNILWIFVSIDDIQDEKNTLKLNQALELEREAKFEVLFDLLSFEYQPALIELIKKNIIGENTIFALEIIDNFMHQEIKQLIIPLLDRISVNQRIKKLSSFFHHPRLEFPERLKDIIKKDYHMLDVWTRAKAIEVLGKIHRRTTNPETDDADTYNSDLEVWTEERADEMLHFIRRSDMPDEIFLSLHHPDELVYSTAAKIVYDENPTRCFDYLQKLSLTKQALIPVLRNETGNTEELIVERIKMLKRIPIFFSVPENLLLKLAKLIRVKQLKKGEELFFQYQDYKEDVFLILRGELEYILEGQEPVVFARNQIVTRGHEAPEEVNSLFSAKKSTVLLASRQNYYNLLVDDSEILHHLFDRIAK